MLWLEVLVICFHWQFRQLPSDLISLIVRYDANVAIIN